MTVPPDSQPVAGTRPAVGQDLLVPLECPQCNKRGWAQVDQLDRGMRCLDCRSWFQVDRNGQALLRRNPREREFTCPRCHVRGVALLDAQDHAVCSGCQLPLQRGPDGKLHSVLQVAAMWKELQEKSLLQRKEDQAAKHRQPSPVPSRAVLILGGCIAAALLALLTYWLLLPPSPTGLAEQLTQHCLAGDWERAELLVGDDEYELSDFERWRITHFASLQQKFRPQDATQIHVEVIDSGADQLVMRVLIRSKMLGTRAVLQYWTKEESGWSFDATASLHNPLQIGLARK